MSRDSARSARSKQTIWLAAVLLLAVVFAVLWWPSPTSLEAPTVSTPGDRRVAAPPTAEPASGRLGVPHHGTTILVAAVDAEKGTPVSDAVVRLTLRRQVVSEPVSIGRGKVRFQTDLKGSMVLTVEASGYRRARQSVDVSGDRTVDVTIRMTSGGTVSGVVVDQEGRPLSQFAVTALVEDEDAHATSGHRGEFSIRGLPATTFSLMLTPPSDSRAVWKGPWTRTVAGAPTDVRLVVTREVDAWSSVTIRAVDRDNRAAPLAECELAPAESRYSVFTSWADCRLAGDSAVYDAIPAGDWLVIVRAEDGRIARGSFSLLPGQRSVVDLRLSTSGPLRGRVVGSGGQPVNVNVDPPCGKGTDGFTPQTGFTVTDRDGRFQLEDFPHDVKVHFVVDSADFVGMTDVLLTKGETEIPDITCWRKSFLRFLPGADVPHDGTFEIHGIDAAWALDNSANPANSQHPFPVCTVPAGRAMWRYFTMVPQRDGSVGHKVFSGELTLQPGETATVVVE